MKVEGGSLKAKKPRVKTVFEKNGEKCQKSFCDKQEAEM